MEGKDVISWTAVISACSRKGHDIDLDEVESSATPCYLETSLIFLLYMTKFLKRMRSRIASNGINISASPGTEDRHVGLDHLCGARIPLTVGSVSWIKSLLLDYLDPPGLKRSGDFPWMLLPPVASPSTTVLLVALIEGLKSLTFSPAGVCSRGRLPVAAEAIRRNTKKYNEKHNLAITLRGLSAYGKCNRELSPTTGFLSIVVTCDIADDIDLLSDKIRKENDDPETMKFSLLSWMPRTPKSSLE
ncbi:hypothetical protein YC2023_001084 [Brassica napus]